MDQQQQQQIHKLHKEGKTLREIAQQLQYHHKTISKYLKQMGAKITNKGNTGKLLPITQLTYKTIKDRDQIITSEYQKGIGSTSIARNLNISKRTVLRILKKNNIKCNNKYTKSRPSKQVVKEKYTSGIRIEKIALQHNVPDYVIRQQLGDLIRTPGETMSQLRGLEKKITRLYQDGLSTYDIADVLGLSHAESIRKFVKKQGLTRSNAEIRKLTAIKLSSQSYKSRPEKKLYTILNKLNIKFEDQYPLDGWNFDFKIANTLLEIQSYWHLLPGRIQRDKKKAKAAKQHNFNLIYLWEHQLKNEEFLEEFLLYQLSLKVPAGFNFCDIKIKKDRIAASGLMQWHYCQKIGRYGHEYVAYLGDIPIATCVFASILRKQTATKQKVGHNEILELSRFVIHPSYHKKNFGSWLISRCSKMLKKDLPNTKKLIAFSDTTYNHNGNIYRASNWTLDGEIPSDYWYVTPTRSIKHKKTVWNAAKKENLIESTYASKYRLQKVFGMPKFRFIKDLD